jgi:hypothetical protein
MSLKFHLERNDSGTFTLYPVKESLAAQSAGNQTVQVVLTNAQDTQPLQFALKVDGAVKGAVITLPDGTQIKCDRAIGKGQFIICKGQGAYLANSNRNKIAELAFEHEAQMPKGESKLGVQFQVQGAAKVNFSLKTWVLGAGEKIEKNSSHNAQR